jgi:hypothetical protein
MHPISRWVTLYVHALLPFLRYTICLFTILIFATRSQRFILYIASSNILKWAAYIAEKGEWKELKFGNGDIRVHPQSRLAACLTPRGILAFYHAAPSGGLTGILIDGINAEVLENIPAEPAVGGALAVLTTGTVGAEQIQVYYLHGDGSIHFVGRDLASGAWEGEPSVHHHREMKKLINRLDRFPNIYIDNILPDSHVSTPITRVIVLLDPETSDPVAAFIAGGVLSVISSGQQHELGKVVGNKFVRSAEPITVGWIPVYVDYLGRFNGRMMPVIYNSEYWNTRQRYW